VTSTGRRVPALGLLLVAAVLLAACSSSGDDRADDPASETVTSTPTAPETASAGCESAEVLPPGPSDRTMTSSGGERSFRVVVPDGYDGTEPLPVVLGLHGLTVDYRAIPSLSGFDDMADRYDFIGVSPSGMLDGTVPFWVAAPVEPNRDVAYLADLLDLLEDELCIDPSQVFSTGMSNGGQMSSVLACQLGDRITAVAPLAGV
jgi:polyhydroxybutyrate depolymerase